MSVKKSGVEIIETITVFDGSGAEVAGLVNGDFTKVLHKDGVSQSAAGVVVAEISGGDYKVTFTPASVGTWRLLIQQSTHNPHGWQATYDVSEGGVLAASDISADVWAYVIETGFSALRVLKIIAGVLAGKTTGGRASFTARNLGDTENVVVGSADESGNRTPTQYVP